METQRLATTAATIFGLALTGAQADLYMELGVNKRHYQVANSKLSFEGGELNLYLRDGLIVVAACDSQPSLSYVAPVLGCTLGTTGFVSWGDFNGDGVSDANQYWSVSSVVPALAVAPYLPQQCSLITAPPSKLPRPLRMFSDGSITLFYNISAVTNQYDVTLYQMLRRYGSVRQVETAVAAGIIPFDTALDGTLNVVVTSALLESSPLTIPAAINLADAEGIGFDSWPEEWAESVRRALVSTPEITENYTVSGNGTSIVLTAIVPGSNDPTLNISIEPGTFTTPSLPLSTSYNTAEGKYVMPATALSNINQEIVSGRYVFAFPSLNNPNVPVAIPVTITNNVEALGSNPRAPRKGFRFTSGVFDGEYYQMDPRVVNSIKWSGNDASSVMRGDEIRFSILSPSEDWLQFPPTVPQSPVTLSTPLATSYTLPPSFFDVGDEGVMQLQFQRTLAVSNVSFDRSWRQFRVKTKFVNSYAGFAQESFPLGVAGDNTPIGDFDRDGMSNIEEYAYEFPSRADIVVAAKQQFVPPTSNTVGLTFEFSRILTAIPSPVSDPLVKPTGPVGPELDEAGRIVYKVPYRANAGTSLVYEFAELSANSKGKVKRTKIDTSKANSPWELVRETGETVTVPVMMEVVQVDSLSREVDEIIVLGNPVPVSVTREFLVLRSKLPVKDPLAPLPNLGVTLRAVELRK